MTTFGNNLNPHPTLDGDKRIEIDDLRIGLRFRWVHPHMKAGGYARPETIHTQRSNPEKHKRYGIWFFRASYADPFNEKYPREYVIDIYFWDAGLCPWPNNGRGRDGEWNTNYLVEVKD